MALFLRGKTWHYELVIHGQRFRGSTKERVKSRAKTFEHLLIARIREKGASQALRKPPLLRNLAEEFMGYIDRRTGAGQMDPDTQRHYKHGWQLVSETALAGMRIDQIGTSEAAMQSYPGGPWNARAAQKTLGRMLNWAAESGLIKSSPKIRRSRAYGRSAVITPDMEAALIGHLNRDGADVLVIMMDCGMRPDEVLRMRWENVLWEKHVIFIPHGKTLNSRRYVPLSDRMERILRARHPKGDEPWVFPGKSVSGRRTTIAKQFEAARKAAGLGPEIVLYCARHGFATSLLSETGDLALVGKLLGHESLATTQRYLHPSTSGVAEIVNRRNRKTGLHLVQQVS